MATSAIGRENITWQSVQENNNNNTNQRTLTSVIRGVTGISLKDGGRKLSNEVINVDSQEYSSIKDFIVLLCENLNIDLYPQQIQELFSIIDSDTILSTTSLTQVKYSVSGLKEKIASVLKNVREQDVNQLESISAVSLVEDIFKLTRIYKKIDEIETLTGEYRDIAILRIFIELNKIGKIEKATEIAELIHDENLKSETLLSLAKSILEKGSIENAIEIAKKIPNLDTQREVLRYFHAIFQYSIDQQKVSISKTKLEKDIEARVNQWIDQKGVDAAVVEAKHLSEVERYRAFSYLAKQYIQTGAMDKAMNVMQFLSRPEIVITAIDIFKVSIHAVELPEVFPETMRVLDQMIQILVSTNNTETVVEIFKTIPNANTRTQALNRMSVYKEEQDTDCSYEWTRKDLKYEGMKLKKIKLITDEQERNHALAGRIYGLIDDDRVGSAFKAAKLISNEYMKTRIFISLIEKCLYDPVLGERAIDRALKPALGERDIDRALKIAEKIPDTKIRSKMLTEISEAALDLNKPSKVVEIVTSIPDRTQKDAVLDRISASYLERCKIIIALKLAQQIHDTQVKSEALDRISETLFKQSRLRKAKEVAKSIPDKKMKQTRLESIATTSIPKKIYEAERLVEKGKTQEAIEIATSINNNNESSIAFYIISMVLFEKNQITEALKVTQLISDGKKRSTVQYRIAQTLIEKDKTNEAIDVATLISDGQERANALYWIIDSAHKKENSNLKNAMSKLIPTGFRDPLRDDAYDLM